MTIAVIKRTSPPVIRPGENTGEAARQASIATAQALLAQAAAIAAELARDQAADLVLPENTFVEADLATARTAGEAGTTNGEFFKAVGIAEGLAEVRLRTGGGSTLLYTEATYALLNSEDGAGIIGLLEDRTVQSAITELLNRSVSLERFEIEGEPLDTGVAAYFDGAMTRAGEWLMANRRFVDIGYGDLYPASLIFVPPGDYKTEGGLWADVSTIGLIATPNTVTIKNEADTYTLQPELFIDQTLLYGIDFVGGKGGFYHTYDGQNVSKTHIIEQCKFTDYTRGAAGSETADMPYWRVRDNTVRPLPGSGTRRRGFFFGGLKDHLEISGNSFEGCVMPLQLGPIRSGNMIVRNNAFLPIEDDVTEYDIWWIPSDQVGTFGTNSGSLVDEGNKYGNEGRTVASEDRARVLVAAMTGTLLEEAEPDLTWKDGLDGANFLTGLVIRDACISTLTPPGTDGVTGSFIDCYIDKFDMNWEASNRIDLGMLKHLVNFVEDTPGDRQPDFINCRSLIDLGPGTGQYIYGGSFREGVSSHPIGIIRDPFGQTLDPQTLLPTNDPGSTTVATDIGGTNWGAEVGITTSPVADRFGNAQATQAVWTIAGRQLFMAVDLTGFEGQRVWVVSDVWVGSDPAAAVDFLLLHPDDFHTLIKKRHRPRAIKTSFVASQIIPEHDDMNTWQLRITLPAITSGTDTAIFGETIVAVGSSCPRLHRYPAIAAPTGGAVQDAEGRAFAAQVLALLESSQLMRG